jgi:hypothetical membrane protein
LFLFCAGFRKWYTREKWRKLLIVLTQAVGFLSAFGLIMIGVFSEDCLARHPSWSDLFFMFNLIVLILANAFLMTHAKFIRPMGYCGLIVAVINVVFVASSNTPLLEWFTVFTALGYAGLLA